MAQMTVTATKFSTSKVQLRLLRDEMRDKDIRCGTIYAVTGGWKFKHWHSGPKVNYR